MTTETKSLPVRFRLSDGSTADAEIVTTVTTHFHCLTPLDTLTEAQVDEFLALAQAQTAHRHKETLR